MSPVTIFGIFADFGAMYLGEAPNLQQRVSVTLDRRKVLFSAFCRSVPPLLMTSLRRIQNLSRFGRLGVGNVSPVTIFGILRYSTVSASPEVKGGVDP